MPLVDIQLIEGVFDENQKQAMINKVADAMVEIEGEAMRGVTWVRVFESPAANGGLAASLSPPLTWRSSKPRGTEQAHWGKRSAPLQRMPPLEERACQQEL